MWRVQVRKANGVFLLGQLLLQDTTEDAADGEVEPPLRKGLVEHGDDASTQQSDPPSVSSRPLPPTTSSHPGPHPNDMARVNEPSRPFATTSAMSVSDRLSASSDEITLVAHVFRTLRFLFSTERNRKVFRRLFSPDLFASFIDVGHFVRELDR